MLRELLFGGGGEIIPADFFLVRGAVLGGTPWDVEKRKFCPRIALFRLDHILHLAHVIHLERHEDLEA